MADPLSVSADATLRGYAPECLREPYLRAVGLRGFADRRVSAAISFVEVVGRFLTALLAPEGGQPEALVKKLDRASLGDWLVAADKLAAKVVDLPDALARPAALALRDARGKPTDVQRALAVLVQARNEIMHGPSAGPDTPRAQVLYDTDMKPALRTLFEGLGFVRALPIYALDLLDPRTGRPTHLLRFVGSETERLELTHRVTARPAEPLLISPDGRTVELGPFMTLGQSGMGLRPQLLEKIDKKGVSFIDPADRDPGHALGEWPVRWRTDGTLQHPQRTPPDPHLAAVVTRPSDRLTGRSVGPYVFGPFIAQGASASVYRGQENGRSVALKVLHAPLRASASHRERLRREVALLRSLDHPHIVRAHDLLEATEHGPILVMDFANGVDLERLFAANPASSAQAVALSLDLLAALTYLHAQQVVHRDVKPANILVEEERAKLVDFGIARDPQQHRMTGTLDRLGTRSFAAPEQAEGTAGPPADVFAAAKVLGWLISGKTREESMLAALPTGLASLVRRAIRPEPGERPSAAAFAQELEALRDRGFDRDAPLSDGDLIGHYTVRATPAPSGGHVWHALGIEKATGSTVRLWFAPQARADRLRQAVSATPARTAFQEAGLWVAVYDPEVELALGPPIPAVVGRPKAAPAPEPPPAPPAPPDRRGSTRPEIPSRRAVPAVAEALADLAADTTPAAPLAPEPASRPPPAAPPEPPSAAPRKARASAPEAAPPAAPKAVPPVVAPPPFGLPSTWPADPEAAQQRLTLECLVLEACLVAAVEGNLDRPAWFARLARPQPIRSTTGLGAWLASLCALAEQPAAPSAHRGLGAVVRLTGWVIPQVVQRLRTAAQVLGQPECVHAAVVEALALVASEVTPLMLAPVLWQAPQGWTLLVDARPDCGARRLAAPETPAPIPQALQADTTADWLRGGLLGLDLEPGLDQQFHVGFDDGRPRAVVGFEGQIDGSGATRPFVIRVLPWMDHRLVRLVGLTDGARWRWLRQEGRRQMRDELTPARWLAGHQR